MTTNDTHILGLSDVDRVIPPEYEILQPTDPRNEKRNALRAVRYEPGAQTHYFYTAQEYFTFATSIAPRHRLLAEEYGTRYVQLSAEYDHDPCFHASVTHTVAALTRSQVILHRMTSDETSLRFTLTKDEMAALVESCQAYLATCESGSAAPEFDPFLDVSVKHE